MKTTETDICIVRYISTTCAGTKLQKHLDSLSRVFDKSIVKESDMHTIVDYLNEEHDRYIEKNTRVSPARATIVEYHLPTLCWNVLVGDKHLLAINRSKLVEP